MARPTTTRAALRKDLCLELGMSFHKLFNGSDTLTGGTSASLKDTKLKQAAGYWNNGWLYAMNPATLLTNGVVTRVTSFSTDSGGVPTLVPESPLPYNPTTETVTFEILSVYSPHEIHGAINQAIASAFPEYFDVVEDATLIVCENTLRYDVSALTRKIFRPMHVWVEQTEYAIKGTVTSSTGTSLTDSTADFVAAGVEDGWLVSIYAGTGAGQYRTIDSIATMDFDITVAWTTQPDATSKYCIWDPDNQTLPDYDLLAVRWDANEFPNTMVFGPGMNQFAGMRIRLVYTAQPEALTSEVSTTIVPREYILYAGLAVLYGAKLNDNAADRQRYATLQERYEAKARQFKDEHPWQTPSTRLWQEVDPTLQRRNSSINPF